MWVTPTEAGQYLADSVGGEAWTALTPDEQSQYLTSAFRILSNDPGYSFPDAVEQPMSDANTELAFWMLSNPQGLEAANLQAQGVAGFKIGNFQMSFHDDDGFRGPRSVYPATVGNLIERYRCELPAHGTLVRPYE